MFTYVSIMQPSPDPEKPTNDKKVSQAQGERRARHEPGQSTKIPFKNISCFIFV